MAAAHCRMEIGGHGCAHRNTIAEEACCGTDTGTRLSGLKEVGAQTTSVGWIGLKLRNYQATPAQGHLGLCMSPIAAHSIQLIL